MYNLFDRTFRKERRMAPILDKNSLEFTSRSPNQTQRLGARLGALLQGGDVICLEGPLGSGKTCLAQGVGRGWGVGQTLISPTYVLIREYTRPDEPVTLHHVDLYRVSGAAEAFDLGLADILGEPYAISIIEWAERAREVMPSGHLWIEMNARGKTHRILTLTAVGERHTELLREFRTTAFGA
jgi:tRNA threonylcarbamoyladenosine biosynthesis protein TsaE